MKAAAGDARDEAVARSAHETPTARRTATPTPARRPLRRTVAERVEERHQELNPLRAAEWISTSIGEPGVSVGRPGEVRRMNQDDRYIIITADTHAGGSHRQYREYLDPKYRDEFDAWREKYKNPFKDLKDTDLRVRNWDTRAARRAAAQRRRRGRGDLPEHRSAVLPELRAVRAAADRDEYELRHAGVQAHNRWLADFVAERPETPGRDRPDLPQRPRRRDRRRRLVQGARPARRRPGCAAAADVQLAEAALRPVLRPAVEGLRGPRGRRSTPTAARAARRTSRRRRCRSCTCSRCRSTRSVRSST